MLRQFATWLRIAARALFTDRSNQTLCIIRVFGLPFVIIASNIFLGLAIYTVVVLHQPLDYVAFGTGLSAVWTVFALGVAGNDLTKPRSPSC